MYVGALFTAVLPFIAGLGVDGQTATVGNRSPHLTIHDQDGGQNYVSSNHGLTSPDLINVIPSIQNALNSGEQMALTLGVNAVDNFFNYTPAPPAVVREAAKVYGVERFSRGSMSDLGIILIKMWQKQGLPVREILMRLTGLGVNIVYDDKDNQWKEIKRPQETKEIKEQSPKVLMKSLSVKSNRELLREINKAYKDLKEASEQGKPWASTWLQTEDDQSDPVVSSPDSPPTDLSQHDQDQVIIEALNKIDNPGKYDAYVFSSVAGTLAVKIIESPGIQPIIGAGGMIVGFLIEKVVLIAIGSSVGAYVNSVQQDLIEGGGVKDTVARFHSVQQVTFDKNGQILDKDGKVIAEMVNADAAESAVTGEQADAQVSEESVRQSGDQKKIAIVDDHPDAAEVLGEIISRKIIGTQASLFLICQDLLRVLDTGQRYDLYIVDYDPGETGGLRGDVCTKKILKRHPGAVIIGRSLDDVGEDFHKSGAKGFISRNEGGFKTADYIKGFLP